MAASTVRAFTCILARSLFLVSALQSGFVCLICHYWLSIFVSNLLVVYFVRGLGLAFGGLYLPGFGLREAAINVIRKCRHRFNRDAFNLRQGGRRNVAVNICRLNDPRYSLGTRVQGCLLTRLSASRLLNSFGNFDVTLENLNNYRRPDAKG